MATVVLHPFASADRVQLLGRADEVLAGVELPMLTCVVPCGFPSPAEDHADERLDIVRRLVRNPASTFFARADPSSTSMVRAGILPNAILIVDRSLHAQHGDIVLAVVSGEFTCKRLYVRDSRLRLVPESDDPRYRAIEPGEGEDVSIWGVVTSAVNEYRRRGH
jgi:DNA polymerase V